MIRFILVILGDLHRIWMIPKMGYMSRHPEKYSEECRYNYDRHVIRLMNNRGRIRTSAYGIENLPREGGYVMFANHQGKYDALGLILTHDQPCAVVMDYAWSHFPLVKQFVELCGGKWLKRDNLRQAAGVIREMTNEVKEGKRFLIFPSGGYERGNGNYVDPFKPGSFKSAMKAKAPIVPVALIDSWCVFDIISLKKVYTKVIYLEPLYYEDYKDMSSVDVSREMYNRICNAIEANS